MLKNVSTYDPKGNAYITFGSNYMPRENTQRCADVLKVAGYNYAEKYYNEHHIKCLIAYIAVRRLHRTKQGNISFSL